MIEVVEEALALAVVVAAIREGSRRAWPDCCTCVVFNAPLTLLRRAEDHEAEWVPACPRCRDTGSVRCGDANSGVSYPCSEFGRCGLESMRE